MIFDPNVEAVHRQDALHMWLLAHLAAKRKAADEGATYIGELDQVLAPGWRLVSGSTPLEFGVIDSPVLSALLLDNGRHHPGFWDSAIVD